MSIRYKRILLKLSGEALLGHAQCGIDPEILQRLAADIGELVAAGAQIGLVIGGGNIFRGAALAKAGLDRVRGDQMGMLATVMNALAMEDALKRQGIAASTLSSIGMDSVCESYSVRRARERLAQGQVVLCAAGTGNPFFTTDTAASLRAIEIEADLLIKATKVNGIYSADPKKVPDARFYAHISYDQALAERLEVMDAAALVLCRDQALPLRVMNIYEPKAMLRALQGEAIGTLVER